jgi:hypothetical protein
VDVVTLMYLAAGADSFPEKQTPSGVPTAVASFRFICNPCGCCCWQSRPACPYEILGNSNKSSLKNLYLVYSAASGGPRVRVHQQLLNTRGARTSSVQGDWSAWMPAPKLELYVTYTSHLEAAYNMFSVELNEALELRRTGKLGKSAQAVSITAQLCRRLAQSLSGLLRVLSLHTKRYRIVSNAAPLSPSNFQAVSSQRSARMSVS